MPFKIMVLDSTSLYPGYMLAEKFLERVPATFEIAYDPEGTVADMYSLKVMPSSYLIDREGNLVHAHKGFKTSDGSRMEDAIRKLLDSK